LGGEVDGVPSLIPFTQPFPLESVSSPEFVEPFRSHTGLSNFVLDSAGTETSSAYGGSTSSGAKRPAFRTSERTGYTEEELVLHGKANGMANVLSDATKKKMNSVARKLASAEKKSAEKMKDAGSRHGNGEKKNVRKEKTNGLYF
jgi:hypothetical protein